MSLKFLVIAGLFFNISCRSTGETQLASKAAPEVIETENKTPPELWSPEERGANANYYYMRAEDAMYHGDRSAALKLFEQAYNLDPNSFLAAKLIAAKAYAEPDKAFMLCKKMVLLYPQDIHLNIIYGQLLLLTRSYKAASMQFERVLRIDNNSLDAHMGLVQSLRSLGKEEAAIQKTEAMLKTDGSFSNGWALLAKLLLAKKRFKKAANAAYNAYDLRPNEPEYQHLYALTLDLTGKSDKALALYEQVFRNHPDNAQLAGKIIQLYQQIGSLKQALLLLEDAKASLRSQQSSFAIDLQQAYIYWELKDFKAAYAVLRRLNQSNPDNPRILFMAGLAAERLQDLLAARSFYAKIVATSPYYGQSQFRLALLHRSKKEYAAAAQIAAAQIAQKGEAAADFSMLLAQIYSDQSRHEEAIEVLESAASDESERVDIQFLLGITQEKAGRVDASIATMQQVIAKDSEHAGALNFLAYTYAEKAIELAKAEQLVKRALAIKPGDGYYLDTLGWVYFKQEKYKAAIETLQKAIVAAPNETVLLEHLADVYLAQGDRRAAQKFYKKAFEANGSDEDRARAKEKFQDLRQNEA